MGKDETPIFQNTSKRYLTKQRLEKFLEAKFAEYEDFDFSVKKKNDVFTFVAPAEVDEAEINAIRLNQPQQSVKLG